MTWDERVDRRIKLRDLRILHAVADRGSMAKAAVALSMSQPAVSHTIAGLERALGVPLFDRHAQGVVPTRFGQALIDRSGVVLNEVRHAVQEIEALADPEAGQLRIGTTQPMAAVAATVIDRLVRLHPRMRFHLVTEGTHLLFDALERRSIELAISRMFEPVDPSRFEADVIFHDELAVIAHRSSPWTRRRRIAMKELMAGPWALPPGDGYLGRLIAASFRAHGLEPPEPALTSPSSHALAMMVMARSFLTIHPRMMLDFPDPHPALVALPVDMRATRNPIGVIRLKGRAMSPIARLFVDATRAEAKTVARRHQG